MNSTSTSQRNVVVSRRQDALVGNVSDITSSILANAGWEHQQRNMASGTPKSKKAGLKMRFPRRNSLNFPPKSPIGREDPEEEDPFSDLVKQRTNSPKAPVPISDEIKRALAVLSDDNVSVSATSAMSNSTVSTSGDDEELKVNESSKDAHAISTPVPQRKKALQIPMAKRKKFGVSTSTTDSPTSVTESLGVSSLPVAAGVKKTKVKKSKSKDSASKSFKKKKDPSGKVANKTKDTAEKSKRRKSTSKKKQAPPPKQVNFKLTCTMRRTLSRKDMTNKEIRKAWLSWEEYHRMQIRDEILADRVDAGRCKPGTCIRGLESKIEESAMKKLHLRTTGFEDVLLEQERQWDEAGDSPKFYYDFESISEAYESISKKALTVAQEVARLDRLEAEKILASSNPFKSKGLRSRFSRRRSWA